MSLLQVAHDYVVSLLSLQEHLDLSVGLSQRLNDLVVSLLLVHLGPLLLVVILSSLSQLVFQLLDDIKVGVCDLLVIRLDVSVFLSMLGCKLLDGLIFLFLDKLDLLSPLVLHLSSQIKHLLLVLGVDLVGDPFELMPSGRLLLVLLFG